MKITNIQIEAIVKRINRLLNQPNEPYWSQSDGSIKANIGSYSVSYGHRGVTLHRLVNDRGGMEDVFGDAYIPRRDLANRMIGFIKGFETAKKELKK